MRRIIGLLAAMILLAMTATTALAEQDQGKVFVCKYVGTPFVDETLQTGDNPISVSVNAIPGYGEEGRDTPESLLGFEFADQHGQSIVIAVDEGQDEPDVSECPAPREPPEPILVTPAVTVTPPTCDADGSVTTTAIEGVTYTVPAYELGVEFTITATLDDGYALAEGATDTFTVTVLAQLTGDDCGSTVVEPTPTPPAPPLGGGTPPDTALPVPQSAPSVVPFALLGLASLATLGGLTLKSRRARR